MSGELEEIQRWAKFARQGAKRASILIRKAAEILGHLDNACARGDTQKAMELKDKASQRVMEAFAACMDPEVPAKEAYTLAMREFGASNHIAVAGSRGRVGARSANDSQTKVEFAKDGMFKKGDWNAVSRKAEGFAFEILKGRSLGIPSEDIVASLAERGFDADKIAEYYSGLLEEVFNSKECNECGRRGGSASMKEKTLKTFLEWKRSMEPKVALEITSDMDGMSEEDLMNLQDRLTPVVLESLLQKEET